MNRLLLLVIAVFGIIETRAQLLTWTPPFPVEDDATQTFVITMDASKGNQGLLNFSNPNDVYVHIGAITNLSNGGWVNVPFTWGTTPAAAKAAYIGSNKWTYTINGSLRSFFSLTNPAEHIIKVAILFRSGNGNSVQRNADASDMFVPVYTSDLAVRITQPPVQPKFTPVPEPQNWILGSVVSVTAVANKPSTITLTHNGTQFAIGTGVTTVSGNTSITSYGNMQIIAEANDGTLIKRDTFNYLVSPPNSPVVELPAGVKTGINYSADNTSVTLVLRAAGKNLAVVTGDFNNWTPGLNHVMNKTPDGKSFWITLTGLTSGTEYAYQFIVDGIKIADPYAEKVLDPFNDQFIPSSTYPALKPYPAGQSGIVSVLQTGQIPYAWSVPNFTRPDKRGLVIYELLLRDFVAAKNWKTLQDSLNYLKTLGINAIELMPVNEFEGNESWGYNPSFYFAPDKYYGTKKAFQEFIDSCHKKGIAVIMDIALNHSFGQSPMVQLYWDAVNNRPSTGNPWYNPTATHPFNVGYDFNHASNETKYFFSRVVEHWLKEYKIDGFRFDLSKGFTQNNTCTTPACNSGTEINNWSNYDGSRVQLWKGYYDTLMLKSPGSYVILEHFAANNEEIELSDYGMMLWGNSNYFFSQASKGDNNGWDFSSALHTARGWTKPHLVSYMESHDEERIVYRNIHEGLSSSGYNIRDTTTALKRMELSASFHLTMPGPKMIWQFGELGYPYSINTCTNLTVDNACRLDNKPIRWDYLNDQRRKNIYTTYSKILQLRAHPWYQQAFMTGTVSKDFSGGVKTMLVSSGDSSHLMVIGNFSTAALSVALTFPVAGTWFNYLTNEVFTASGGTQGITLLPGEYKLFVNRNVNNVAVTPVSNIPALAGSLNARLYPNPVLSKFIVDLELPVSGIVNINLYNDLGQHVKTLHNGYMVRGNQKLQLDRTNVSGGVYFIKIGTKTTSQTISVTIQ